MRILGLLLLLFGFVMTINAGMYLAKSNDIRSLGSAELRRSERAPIQWAPATGSVLIVAGIVIVIAGGMKIKKNRPGTFRNSYGS